MRNDNGKVVASVLLREEVRKDIRLGPKWDSSKDHFGLDETMDNLRAMLRQEAEIYHPCVDYLSKLENEGPDKICEAWRRKLCEWCYSVVDHFNYDREVVSFAVAYLDRTVAAMLESFGQPPSQRKFQLLAVTSLYLAIKLHAKGDERSEVRQRLRIGTYVGLSRGFFNEQAIEETEVFILQTLNWTVNPPTAISVITLMMRLNSEWAVDSLTYDRVMGAIFDIARYLAELAICVSAITFSTRASTIAFASVLFAMDCLPPHLKIPPDVQDAFLGNIVESTGLYPTDPDVCQAIRKLRALRPALATHARTLIQRDLDSDGKVSPVCVADVPAVGGVPREAPDEADEGSRTARKRTRSDYKDLRKDPSTV